MDDLPENVRVALDEVMARSNLTDDDVRELERSVRVALMIRTEGVAEEWTEDSLEPQGATKNPRIPSMVGQRDIATLFGCKPGLIRQWKLRGKLPHPSDVVDGKPLWGRAVISQWLDDVRACG